MKRGRPWILFGVAGCLVIGVCVLAGLAGARVNTTRSIPKGLYWTTESSVTKGSYVLFCPPRNEVFDEARKRGYIGSGFCPGGYGYMMKKVLAAKHDAISVDDDGVRVNGKLLPQSVPLETDGVARPLPRYRVRNQVLRASEFLLMSDGSAISFDGRYFGPIDQMQIKSVLRPVLTWN